MPNLKRKLLEMLSNEGGPALDATSDTMRAPSLTSSSNAGVLLAWAVLAPWIDRVNAHHDGARWVVETHARNGLNRCGDEHLAAAAAMSLIVSYEANVHRLDGVP